MPPESGGFLLRKDMERLTGKSEAIGEKEKGYVIASFDSRQSQFVWEAAKDHGLPIEIFPGQRQHVALFPPSKWNEIAQDLEQRGISFQHSVIMPTGEITGNFLQTVEEWQEEGTRRRPRKR